MSALFDFPSLLVVLLLFICSTAFLRSLYPSIFNTASSDSAGPGAVTGSSVAAQHKGLYGLCWKASRVGERLSPIVAVSCVVMAFHLLFLKE